MPNELTNLCNKEGIKSLFEIPSEHKIFVATNKSGYYSIPVIFVMYPNNFLIGTDEEFTRIYVGKVGDMPKKDSSVLPLTLFYMDFSDAYERCDDEFCPKTTKYLGYMSTSIYDKPLFISKLYDHERTLESVTLPKSNGTFYKQIRELNNDYYRSSIIPYLYAQVQASLEKDPTFYLVLKTIEKCCNESSREYKAEELAKIYQELNEKLIDKLPVTSFTR